ncbi:MAG: phage shock protein operon transcriptional activator [Gammaproteobacteria bacterium]|nr:phage shock protein operon transcriptional activator [Gammaproteobacteria bacterium]
MAALRAESTPIIGQAQAFLEALEHVSRAAPLAKPVLVIGERGTGKELFSARLHYLSTRWEQPLVKLNCAALTESILESELFGHDAGAFTGATREHIGRFERADGGTLILDELATVPLRMQEKILRVIEYGEFERVGGSKTIRVDVRIVGSTNADLPALAHEGAFREDLLDRLAFDVIVVPPLRARQDDILELAQHFAVTMTSELQRSYFPGFTLRAASTLLSYRWPGNVRELKNAVERSVYRLAKPDVRIDRIHFDPFDSPFMPKRKPAAKPAVAPEAQVQVEQPASHTSAPPETPDPLLPCDLKQELADLEIEYIRHAMEESRYNQRRAADALGLTYHQLRACLRKHNLLGEVGRARNETAV